MDDKNLIPNAERTPEELREINSQNTSTIIRAFSAGLISQKTALLELQESGSEIGAWTKITDEDIDKASDEIESGEEEQDPMAAMMGGGDPTAMDPAEMAQMGAQSAPTGPEEKNPCSRRKRHRCLLKPNRDRMKTMADRDLDRDPGTTRRTRSEA